MRVCAPCSQLLQCLLLLLLLFFFVSFCFVSLGVCLDVCVCVMGSRVEEVEEAHIQLCRECVLGG